MVVLSALLIAGFAFAPVNLPDSLSSPRWRLPSSPSRRSG